MLLLPGCNVAVQDKGSRYEVDHLHAILLQFHQCRACRLLGNLAKSKKASQYLNVHYAAIAPAICHIIESTSAVQTRIMAFRVCRFLLASSQFLKHFLVANGFLQLMRIFLAVMKNDEAPKETVPDIEVSTLIGLKRNQHREKYFEEVARNLEGVRSDIFDYQMLKNSTRNCDYALPKENEAAVELALEILKCLVLISAQQIGMKAWEVSLPHPWKIIPNISIFLYLPVHFPQHLAGFDCVLR